MSKNVVVVGASAAGVGVVKGLLSSLPKSHRIILIDANEVAFWPIGALRASVVPGFEKGVVASFDSVFPSGSQHIVLKSTKVITLEEDAVVIDREVPGFGSRIPFDRAVLAIGSTYDFPCRPSSPSKEGILQSFRVMQQDIKRSSSILIVGGGSVGVEFAGEVRNVYPNKKVTIVAASSILVPSNPTLHKNLSRQLKAANVEVILNDRVELMSLRTRAYDSLQTFGTKSGIVIEADFILNGSGSKPNGHLATTLDASAVNNNGAIRVHQDFRVNSTKMSRYFAVGDVNDLDVIKTSFAATAGAAIAAENIVSLIKSEDAKTKKFGGVPNVMGVPLGPKGGAIYMFYFTFGEWITSAVKGKKLFIDNFHATYKG